MTLAPQSHEPPIQTERPAKFVHTQASLLLDLVRALAAFIVFSEHWRNLFFLDFSRLPAHRSLYFLPYLLVSAGHQAVVIFFVLSGYLISGSVFRMFERDRWSWGTYLLHRLLRLWIVLLPGLIVTAVADRVGMSLHRASAVVLYAGLSGDHVIGPVRETAGFLTAIGNFFFLQGVRVAPFGSDGALWSLANEFWYYLLFPLALIALRRKSPLRTRLIHAALFLIAAWFLRQHILEGFPIWLFGTLLAVSKPPRCGSPARWLAAGTYAVLFYAFARAPQLQVRWADQLLGVATCIFLWILLSATAPADGTTLRARVTRLFARFSYTLYVAHTPLLALIAALALGGGRWLPDPPHLAASLAILLFVLGLCYLLATQTEFRTDTIRSAIERRLQLTV
jgi:peptidoglycan/LPS O-acetylase OafA/YrhL